MKTLYVKDISKGVPITGQTFVVQEMKVAQDKNGNPYHDLVLADKTGQIKCKIWSDSYDQVDKTALKVGSIVSIDAQVGEYKGSLQLTISKLTGVDEGKIDDYMESSHFPAEQMMEELEETVKGISDKEIKALLQNLLGDKETAAKIKYWPAAVSYHHDFRSGLLQHILECLALAKGFERFYPDLNTDIVTAGIILHDIGKLEEIDASGFTSRYTVKGSVLGHMELGNQIIEKFKPEGMTEKTLLHLKHIVLSHHGMKEKGSPVLPATPEALLIAYIDDTSARVQMGEKGLRETPDEFGMTPYNRWLERWLWAGSRELPVEALAESEGYPNA